MRESEKDFPTNETTILDKRYVIPNTTILLPTCTRWATPPDDFSRIAIALFDCNWNLFCSDTTIKGLNNTEMSAHCGLVVFLKQKLFFWGGTNELFNLWMEVPLFFVRIVQRKKYIEIDVILETAWSHSSAKRAMNGGHSRTGTDVWRDDWNCRIAV